MCGEHFRFLFGCGFFIWIIWDREEMLRRWRETEWGTILGHRKQSKEPKQAKRWIGGSFEIGNILGVNILAEPAESIRERMSNRSVRSARSKPGPSSSSQLDGATQFYTPNQSDATSFFAQAPEAGGSILRPTLGVELEDEGRRAQSDFGARPPLTISTSTPAVKSDTHVPVIAKQRERLVHYAQSPTRDDASPAPPSEVLERTTSELPDTSAQAMSMLETPKSVPWGEVVMRGWSHLEMDAFGHSQSRR